MTGAAQEKDSISEVRFLKAVKECIEFAADEGCVMADGIGINVLWRAAMRRLDRAALAKAGVGGENGQ